MKSGSTTTSRDERLRRTSAFLIGKVMGGLAARPANSEREPREHHDESHHRNRPARGAAVGHREQIKRYINNAGENPKGRPETAAYVSDDERQVERDEGNQVLDVVGERAGGAAEHHASRLRRQIARG